MNLNSPFAFALVAIVGLSLLGLPVAYAMIGGSILWLFMSGLDLGTAAEQMLNGMMASQLLLAIPLFILAASFMSTGSILDRLLTLLQRGCRALPRWARAGERPAGHRACQHVGFRSRRCGGLGQADADDDDARRKVSAGIRRRADLCVVRHRADHPAVDPAGALCADFGHVGRLPLPRWRDTGLAPRCRPERAHCIRGEASQLPGRKARAAARAPSRDLGRVAGALHAGDPARFHVERDHHPHRGRCTRRRVRVADLRIAVPQPAPDGRLPCAGFQCARHGVDRHADRRRDGLQLRHHVGEHPEDAERDAEGLRDVTARVPADGQRICCWSWAASWKARRSSW